MTRTPAVYDIVSKTALRGPSFNFSEISLLVADGTHGFRKMVSRVLTRFGFHAVYEASDGEEALEMLKYHHVDIVMTEWHLDALTGYELIQKLRHDSELADPEIRLIMLTGLTEKARVLAARDAGVDGFLRKPVSPDTLFKRIVGVIEHPIGLANLEAAEKAAQTDTSGGPDADTAPDAT
jgi:CheY-like chemotaxis protein